MERREHLRDWVPHTHEQCVCCVFCVLCVLCVLWVLRVLCVLCVVCCTYVINDEVKLYPAKPSDDDVVLWNVERIGSAHAATHPRTNANTSAERQPRERERERRRQRVGWCWRVPETMQCHVTLNAHGLLRNVDALEVLVMPGGDSHGRS
jgi:hypothetical protein